MLCPIANLETDKKWLRNMWTVPYKLYDKRDEFEFSIVNYPNLGANIAKVCGYGLVKSELKHYSRLSSKFSDF